MHPTPKVTIDVSGLDDVKTAKSTINGLKDKSVNVSVNYKQSGSPSGVNGAHGIGFAHGSMAWSKAFSQGTVSNLTDFSDWNGDAFANGSIRKLSSRALASGDIGANYSGMTLTSELGPEMLVRGNRWTLLGENGAQFTNIKRGDIVFDHQQTADLLSKGHTNSRASIKGGMSAFAHGTAFASGHKVTGSGAFQGGAAAGYAKHSSSSSSKATKKNTEATKKNTAAKKKNTKSTSKFATLIDHVGKQFDFIAIKLDRASAATEKFANMINDYVTSSTKTQALWNEYKAVGKEISTNKTAASKYKSYANDFANDAIKSVSKTKGSSKKSNQKKLKKYFARVRNGSMNINTITNDNMRSAVEHYQDLYQKYLDCNNAVQQLKNTQRELFNQWLNMPIEEAQKKIDKLAKSYDVLAAKISAVSTGGSGISILYNVEQKQISSAKSVVDSKTKARNAAKANNDKAKSNLSKAKKEDSKAKSTQSKQASKAKKAINNQKGLSSSKKKSLTKNIKSGKKISTKGLKGNALKQAKAYNKTVTTRNKTKKAVSSAQSKVTSTGKTLSSANASLQEAQAYYKQLTNNKAVADEYKDAPAYEYQNYLLAQQLNNKKSQNDANQTALKNAQKNYNKYNNAKTSAKKKLDSAKKKVTSKGSKILSSKSNLKKLSASQEKAIKSGKTVSTKGVKNKKLLKQLQDYNKLVKASKSSSSAYTAATQNAADALNALNTAQENASSSAAELAQEQVNAAMQSQANIKAYYDAQQSYESIQGNIASSAAKLKQATGEDLMTEDYQKQIDANEKQAKLYEESAKTMQENLDKKIKDGAIKENSQEWMQLQGEIDACKGSADDLRATNEDLKNSMRDDIYYRGFERAIKAAQNLQNSLTTISSLIDEDAMFDDDGNLTDYGTSAIASNIANVRSEKDELKQLMEERAEMFKHRNEYSDTQWAEAIQKSDQDIADAVKSIKSAEDSVTTILKNNAKQKLDSINKTIDAYKEAIKKSNDYYTYDKQLKSSNKDIQILKSQINALNGVNACPFLFNCWNLLKTIKLKRKNEIYLSVNVMKIEKINCMTIWRKPKWSFLMQ